MVVATGAAGTFSYALLACRMQAQQPGSQNQAGTATVIVSPLPTASISGATAVCQNSSAPDITFTGANGTAPYTFTYQVNGGFKPNYNYHIKVIQ